MHITLAIVFLVLAAVMFFLDGVRVSAPPISWTPLGFMFVTLAWITSGM